MPRLTNKTYLQIHHQLKKLWTGHSHFGHLSANEQQALHAYFQPSKDLSDRDLLSHRRVVTKQRPSLPNQAGKAWAHLQRILSGEDQPVGPHARRVPQPVGKRGRPRRIIVYGELRPEPDVDRIIRVLKDMVTSAMEEDDLPAPELDPVLTDEEFDAWLGRLAGRRKELQDEQDTVA